MNIIFEISKVILPAIITGLFTFLITKYTYSKNVPLDKLEISYNRIYYPLYRIMSDKNMGEDINKNINMVIDKSKIYFIKYNKYIDIYTKRLFESLCKCTKETKRQAIYSDFILIIYDRNHYLRRKLGYLEPNVLQSCQYITFTEKSLFNVAIALCGVYVSIISCSITINRNDAIYNISKLIFVISITCMITQFIISFIRFLYYKIRK